MEGSVSGGCVEGAVMVEAQEALEDGQARLLVSDTGQGISAEDLEHIFERFYRSGNPVSSEDSSTGLGLAIVKRILDLHGSRITVNSQPNQGTRFEFDLPAAA